MAFDITEKQQNGRVYSSIGVVLQDYSNGTGNSTIRVTANMSPGTFAFLLAKASAGVENFEFSEEKIFGEPVFQHTDSMRGFENVESDGGWDMLVEARPVDIDHRVDEGKVASLFQEIVEDPPELPREEYGYDEVIDAAGEALVDSPDDDTE